MSCKDVTLLVMFNNCRYLAHIARDSFILFIPFTHICQLHRSRNFRQTYLCMCIYNYIFRLPFVFKYAQSLLQLKQRISLSFDKGHYFSCLAWLVDLALFQVFRIYCAFLYKIILLQSSQIYGLEKSLLVMQIVLQTLPLIVLMSFA